MEVSSFDTLVNSGEPRRAGLPMAAPSGTVLSERRQSESLDDPTWHDAGGGVVNGDSGQSNSRQNNNADLSRIGGRGCARCIPRPTAQFDRAPQTRSRDS